MRLSICFFAILACQSASAESADYAAEFQAARSVEKSDPQKFVEGMLRSFHHAADAGSHEYTSVAGLNACSGIYHQGKTVEAGKLARDVLTAMDPLKDDFPESTILRRVQIFGYLERGLFAEGKTGAAWQANRAAAETLRGKKMAANSDGPAITLADLDHLSPELFSFGLRVIEREAALLDVAGRSIEARTLLDSTATHLGKDWLSRLEPTQRFYAFKLLAARAQLMDFLGYENEAIQAEQELANSLGGDKTLRNSHLTLRINLLRNLSQWTGPSQEILDEARAIAAELNTQGIDNNVNGLLAKMEFDLEESRQPVEMLRQSALKRRGVGDAYEAFHSDRDNLALRVKLGDPNLDADFGALLRTLRAHGHKSGEPTLYRMYGDYLLGQKRPAEAIGMYAECLRMTRGFGWFLHEPKILGLLIDARIAGGDLDGARATLAELVQWLEKHSDAPATRRAGAQAIRAIALAQLGDETGAREAFRRAREIGRDLPAYQQRAYTEKYEELVIQEIPKAPSAVASVSPPQLRVQPLEIVGIAEPGKTAHTRFSVFNPTACGILGHFLLTGPGAAAGKSNSILFLAGQPSISLRQPWTVAAGSEAQIEVALAADTAINSAKVTVAWENEGQPPGPAASWDVSWDPAASRSIVLDASRLEANPYRSVALFHELAIPIGETDGIAFRLRSSVPLRFEYLDAHTHQLVAIDANGNGDFNDAGDLHVRGPDGVTAAIFPIAAGARTLTAEVRIFSPDGLPLLATGVPLVLEAEVYRDGNWTKEAEDTLK